MKTAPLWAYADVRPSNVDKKSKPDERAVRLVNYTDVYYNQIITTEFELMMATASDEHIERFGVLPGDIIITKDSEAPDDIGIPAQIVTAEDDMVCAYHLTLLRPWRDRTFSRYLYWVLESTTTKDYWLTSSFGVTRYSIGSGVVSRLPVVDVDLDAQRAIADYLDRETGEIDAMIAKMDELADALGVRRSKAVAEYVECQCEGAPMLPLGVASPFTTGATPPTKNGKYFGEGFAWANISDLGPKTIDKTAKSITPEGFAAASFGPMAQSGDLLFSFKLSVGTVSIAAAPMLTNEAIATFRPNGSLDMRFAYYMLPLYLSKAANVNIYGAPLLNGGIMNRARVPVPLREEQRRIADHLDEVTGKIDVMLAKVAELKSLLIERRAALITDVVTGRKKVA